MPASILSGSLRKDGSFRNVCYISNIGYSGRVLVNFDEISQVKSFSKIYILHSKCPSGAIIVNSPLGGQNTRYATAHILLFKV
jgi:hypothetical protein